MRKVPSYLFPAGGNQNNPIVCGRKFCPRCGKWRLLIDFRRRQSSTEVGPITYCGACERASRRDRYRAWTQAQRDNKREANRFYMEKWRREQGAPVRQFKNRRSVVDRSERVFLPPEPLLAEIRRFLAYHDMSWADLAKATGVDPRQLFRWRSGESERVRVDIADQVATGMGIPLATIYPYEEQEAA